MAILVVAHAAGMTAEQDAALQKADGPGGRAFWVKDPHGWTDS